MLAASWSRRGVGYLCHHFLGGGAISENGSLAPVHSEAFGDG